MCKYSNNILNWHLLLVFLQLFFLVRQPLAEDLLQWERFGIKADLSITTLYNDNIYRTHLDRKDDFLTEAITDVEFNGALTERAHATLHYKGIFDHYYDVDNFKSDHHFVTTDFKYASEKGSSILLGLGIEDGAEQPFSENDQSKEYWLTNAHAEVDWKMGAVTALGASYKHDQCRFDQERYKEDDYQKNSLGLFFYYERNIKLPWLAEYRFEEQENDNLEPFPSRLNSQAILTGFRFRPEQRLSGTVEIGYVWSELNHQNAYDGWMTDSDIKYQVGSKTDVKLSAARGVRSSRKAARETLDYYIFSRITLELDYRRFLPVRFSLKSTYENREYRIGDSKTSGREDDFYSISIGSNYQLKKWCTFSLGYSYRKNTSDQIIQKFNENLIMAEVVLSI